MKIELTSDFCQEIVDRVMAVLPYNVNIMNREGIIIASGQRERIGTIHNGARTAINMNCINEIYESTPIDRQGINIPFYYEDTLMGVVGISGDPDNIRPQIKLIRITVELMFAQQAALNREGQREMQLNSLLNDFAYNDKEQTHPFFRERADALGMRLDIPRVCVALKPEKLSSTLMTTVGELLQENEYILRFKTNYFLCYMQDSLRLAARLSQLVQQISGLRAIGVGGLYAVMSRSVEEAVRAAEIADILQRAERICFYREIIPYDILLQSGQLDVLAAPIEKLLEYESADLAHTLAAYLYYSGEISGVAKALHIHRNTLYYRIAKIKDITGKDPEAYDDLFHLQLAHLAFCLKNHRQLYAPED